LMNLSPVEKALIKAFEGFEIIDAHEHLPPERVAVGKHVDALTLFSHYTRYDLITAGMSDLNYERTQDPMIPLEERWELFAPYLKDIRYGSYARPAFIAAKEFYGFDDINEGNYKALSERMAAANRSGIYARVLRDKCNIRTALTQNDYGLDNRTEYDQDLLVPIMLLDTYADPRSRKDVEARAAGLGEKVRILDDYLDVTRKGLERWKQEGVAGIKMVSSPFGDPDREAAVSLFDGLMTNGAKELPALNPLRSYITDAMLDMASELDLVVAVHTGVWGDFRTLDPQHMIPLIMGHTGTKFDLYHMGVPSVRETAIMGKNFPNVWLNLCWDHILSPKMTCSLLDELIDLVPINKIIAFGGDYHRPVEKVYGHLVMARENIAKVLGGRIEDGLMTEEEAISIAERWFCHNPKELYRLRISFD
jgi:predicted TIM-barrel fold metal-dependent hydrolase